MGIIHLTRQTLLALWRLDFEHQTEARPVRSQCDRVREVDQLGLLLKIFASPPAGAAMTSLDKLGPRENATPPPHSLAIRSDRMSPNSNNCLVVSMNPMPHGTETDGLARRFSALFTTARSLHSNSCMSVAARCASSSDSFSTARSYAPLGGGFIFAIIAVIIAVARKPSLDTTALERHDDEDTETSSAPSTSPSSRRGRSPRSSRARLSSCWSYSCR